MKWIESNHNEDTIRGGSELNWNQREISQKSHRTLKIMMICYQRSDWANGHAAVTATTPIVIIQMITFGILAKEKLIIFGATADR